LSGEDADASYFHGKDGMGDAGLPAVPTSFADKLIKKEGGVSEAILKLADESNAKNEKFTIVTLGPLTNIANLLVQRPDFASSFPLVDLVIMGGCGNAHGNASRVAGRCCRLAQKVPKVSFMFLSSLCFTLLTSLLFALLIEFNFLSDVEAAAAVLSKWNCPTLTIIPWELNILRPLPWKSFERLIVPTKKSNRTTNFLTKICKKIYIPNDMKDGDKRSTEGGENSPTHQHTNINSPINSPTPTLSVTLFIAVICDALAVAVAIDPSIIQSSKQTHVEVDTREGITRGMTVCDWGCYDGVERPKNVKWVLDVSVNKYEGLLEAALLTNDNKEVKET
jgi:inosine-uridine nucleoside N-ribohydrolase